MNIVHTATALGFANRYGYTDIKPFEVIRKVSDKCYEIREMNAERDETVKLDFQIGGFLARCTNQHDQKWIITPNESGYVTRIRLGKHGWRDSSKSVYNLSEKPVMFYDYNF
jgi:hypothetical protein